MVKFFKPATGIALAASLTVVLFGMSTVIAQDLEPRAYSPAPVGTNFLLLTYFHSSGDVLLDPSLPIQNASVQFNTAAIGSYNSFDLLHRQTTATWHVTS